MRYAPAPRASKPRAKKSPAKKKARPNPPVRCKQSNSRNKYIGAKVKIYGGVYLVTGCFKMPGTSEVRYTATNLATGKGTTLTKRAVAGLAARAPAKVSGRRVTRRKLGGRVTRRKLGGRARNALGQYI